MFASFNARALGLCLSAGDALCLAASHGFGGVDVMIRDAVEQGEDLAALRRQTADLGLKGGAFPLPIEWKGGPDEFASGLRLLPSYAEAAATLGLVGTGTWVPPLVPVPPGADPLSTLEQARSLWMDRLAAIAEVLNGFGLRFGVEVIGVESSRQGEGVASLHRLDHLEPFLLRDLRERLATCSPGSPVGVVVDSWHLYAAREPIGHALDLGVDRIIWVHLADLPAGASADPSAMIDSVRGLPGEHGAIDSRALLRALREGGYRGPVTPEPLAGCRSLAGLSPEAVAEEAARAMRSVWPVEASSPLIA